MKFHNMKASDLAEQNKQGAENTQGRSPQESSGALHYYFGKMSGGGTESPPRVSISEIFWSWLGGFLGIAGVGLAQTNWITGDDRMLVIGSFGATAILIYGAITSPMAQPRNVLGGHVISAFVGVTCFLVFGGWPWLAGASAVSLAMVAMHLTRTLHPPGGATALIAVVGSAKIHTLGFLYPFIPVGLGALIMLFVALVINNIPRTRRYPLFWW